MHVYLDDEYPEMTKEEFWTALGATKDRYGWRVEWSNFNEKWFVRAINGDTFCPITAVAYYKTDSLYEACEWDDAISSTTGINLQWEFAHKVVQAADDDPKCDSKIRARILEVLGLTEEDKLNRERNRA